MASDLRTRLRRAREWWLERPKLQPVQSLAALLLEAQQEGYAAGVHDANLPDDETPTGPTMRVADMVEAAAVDGTPLEDDDEPRLGGGVPPGWFPLTTTDGDTWWLRETDVREVMFYPSESPDDDYPAPVTHVETTISDGYVTESPEEVFELMAGARMFQAVAENLGQWAVFDSARASAERGRV